MAVEDAPDERALHVERLADGSRLTVHLRDSWTDMPAADGDVVHVLAEIQHAPDGSLHAVCTYDSGAGLTSNYVHCLRWAW